MTGLVEVRHAQGVEQDHDESEQRCLEVTLEEQRSRMQRRKQRREDDRRVDVAGVVGQDQDRPVELANFVQPVDANAIAQRKRQAGKEP